MDMAMLEGFMVMVNGQFFKGLGILLKAALYKLLFGRAAKK